MLFATKLPDWLVACFRIALLGEIYPNIRAVAVGYHDSSFVLIRYYLDRQSSDFDFESLEVVATNLDALGGKEQAINKIDIHCVHAAGAKRDLEPISGFIYILGENTNKMGRKEMEKGTDLFLLTLGMGLYLENKSVPFFSFSLFLFSMANTCSRSPRTASRKSIRKPGA